MSTGSLRMLKLGYLRVTSRILKRNVYESAQINSMKQHSQQWILKKAERSIYHRCVMSDWLSNLFTEAFLVGYTSLHEQYGIGIYTQRTTKLFTPIMKSFVALKMLIQNVRTRWFTVRTLHCAFV